MSLPPPSASGLPTFAFAADLPASQLRLHSRQMMLTLSYAIEDLAAASGPQTVLIATFQRLSLYRPQIARYANLAPQIAQVFVLGLPDISPPPIPKVTVLPIEASWPLTQEWAVIACGPTCSAALISRDTEGFRPDRRSLRFAGRWTTDRREVTGVIRRFYATLGQSPPLVQPDDRASLRSGAAIREALTRRSAE